MTVTQATLDRVSEADGEERNMLMRRVSIYKGKLILQIDGA